MLLFGTDNREVVDDDAAENCEENLEDHDDVDVLEDLEGSDGETTLTVVLVLEDVAWEAAYYLVRHVKHK